MIAIDHSKNNLMIHIFDPTFFPERFEPGSHEEIVRPSLGSEGKVPGEILNLGLDCPTFSIEPMNVISDNSPFARNTKKVPR